MDIISASKTVETETESAALRLCHAQRSQLLLNKEGNTTPVISLDVSIGNDMQKTPVSASSHAGH